MLKDAIIILLILYAVSAGFKVRVGDSYFCVNGLVPQLSVMRCK